MSNAKRIPIPVNDIYIPVINCRDRYLFLFGSKGSGKSDFGAVKKVLRLQCERNHKMLFVRKVKETLKESLFDATKTVIRRDFKTYDLYDINKTDKSFRFRPNDNRIIMTGVDDPEKLKSISGITSALIEEITELTEADFLELDSRLRGQTTNYQQIISMFNPVDENHWLKQYVEPDDVEFEYPFPDTKECWRFYHEDEHGTRLYTTVLNTTYLHNYFIGKNYGAILSRDKANLTVNKYGRWGKKTNTNPAWFGYSEEMITENATFKRDKGIHCSFDQNLKPYFTNICAHIYSIGPDHFKISFFDEVCTEPPNSRAVANCMEFKKRYPITETDSYVYLYGDSSTGVGSTLVRAGVTAMTQIRQELKAYLQPSSDRTVSKEKGSNPPVAMSTEFVNLLMSGYEAGGLRLDFEFNPKCVNLIEDMREQTADADGKPVKKKVTVKDENGNKITYEQLGHCSDALRYLIVKAFAKYWNKFSGRQ